MAQYRLSAKIMSRSGGRSIVAAAAYRSGEKLDDRSHGTTQDYSRRSGVVHSEIVLPENAPEWAADRGELWSRVEERETRDNAQLAREVLLSLPHELSDGQRVELVQEFAQHIAAEYGVAVDMNLHAPSAEGDDRNQHAHLLLTARGFDESRADGWAKAKDPRFDGIAMQRAGEKNAVEAMREVFETMQNRALERANIRDERGELVQVDARSLADQGKAIEPTIHLGPAATEIQRRGEDSDRAAINDEIRERNAANQNERQPTDERAQIEREAAAVKLEMAELFETMANRPGIMMQFERRQKELEALHAEAEELLNPPDRHAADRMNELLLSGPLADLDNDRARHGGYAGDGRFAPRRHTSDELDEFNRELTEPDDDRGRDTDKGEGREIIQNTFPERDDEEITRPAPSRSFGRSR